MKRRGTIRKRSLAVNFSGEAPARGTPVMAGTSTIGEITSSDGHNAIALVRLDRLEAAAETPQAGGQTARIDVPDKLRPEAAAQKV
jgi:tRNA-modifying protein YgfZ